MSLSDGSSDLRQKLHALRIGAKHAIVEGVPGYLNWLNNLVEKAPDFEDIKEMGRDKYDLLIKLKDRL